MAIIASDNFNRTQSGLGSADTGGVWQLHTWADYTPSPTAEINGTHAVITIPAGGNSTRRYALLYLPSVEVNTEILLKVTLPNRTTDPDLMFGAASRLITADRRASVQGFNFYQGNTRVWRANGVLYGTSAYANQESGSVSFSSGSNTMWVRAQMYTDYTGKVFQNVRVWNEISVEPTTWLTYNDPYGDVPTTSEGFGFFFAARSTTLSAPLVAHVDLVEINDMPPQVDPTPSGGTKVVTTFPIESEHTYSGRLNYTYTWTYTIPGASFLEVQWPAASPSYNQVMMEPEKDFLYLMNGDESISIPWTGSEAALFNRRIPGDTVKIRMTTDATNSNFYGFKIGNIASVAIGQDVPPAPTSVVVSGVPYQETSRATIKWNARWGDLKYNIMYRISGGVWQVHSTYRVPVIGSSNFVTGTTSREAITAPLNNLTANTNYEFAVVALNEFDGASSLSNIVAYVTPATNYTPAPFTPSGNWGDLYTVLYDEFRRPATAGQANWGRADSGEPWSGESDYPESWSLTGSSGIFTARTYSQQLQWYPSASARAHTHRRTRYRLRVKTMPTWGNATGVPAPYTRLSVMIGYGARFINGVQTPAGYMAEMEAQNAGATTTVFRLTWGGQEGANRIVLGEASVSSAEGDWFWVEGEAFEDAGGYRTRMKFWKDGTTEPLAWTWDVLDGLTTKYKFKRMQSIPILYRSNIAAQNSTYVLAQWEMNYIHAATNQVEAVELASPYEKAFPTPVQVQAAYDHFRRTSLPIIGWWRSESSYDDSTEHAGYYTYFTDRTTRITPTFGWNRMGSSQDYSNWDPANNSGQGAYGWIRTANGERWLAALEDIEQNGQAAGSGTLEFYQRFVWDLDQAPTAGYASIHQYNRWKASDGYCYELETRWEPNASQYHFIIYKHAAAGTIVLYDGYAGTFVPTVGKPITVEFNVRDNTTVSTSCRVSLYLHGTARPQTFVVDVTDSAADRLNFKVGFNDRVFLMGASATGVSSEIQHRFRECSIVYNNSANFSGFLSRDWFFRTTPAAQPIGTINPPEISDTNSVYDLLEGQQKNVVVNQLPSSSMYAGDGAGSTHHLVFTHREDDHRFTISPTNFVARDAELRARVQGEYYSDIFHTILWEAAFRVQSNGDAYVFRMTQPPMPTGNEVDWNTLDWNVRIQWFKRLGGVYTALSEEVIIDNVLTNGAAHIVFHAWCETLEDGRTYLAASAMGLQMSNMYTWYSVQHYDTDPALVGAGRAMLTVDRLNVSLWNKPTFVDAVEFGYRQVWDKIRPDHSYQIEDTFGRESVDTSVLSWGTSKSGILYGPYTGTANQLYAWNNRAYIRIPESTNGSQLIQMTDVRPSLQSHMHVRLLWQAPTPTSTILETRLWLLRSDDGMSGVRLTLRRETTGTTAQIHTLSGGGVIGTSPTVQIATWNYDSADVNHYFLADSNGGTVRVRYNTFNQSGSGGFAIYHDLIENQKFMIDATLPWNGPAGTPAIETAILGTTTANTTWQFLGLWVTGPATPESPHEVPVLAKVVGTVPATIVTPTEITWSALPDMQVGDWVIFGWAYRYMPEPTFNESSLSPENENFRWWTTRRRQLRGATGLWGGMLLGYVTAIPTGPVTIPITNNIPDVGHAVAVIVRGSSDITYGPYPRESTAGTADVSSSGYDPIGWSIYSNGHDPNVLAVGVLPWSSTGDNEQPMPALAHDRYNGSTANAGSNGFAGVHIVDQNWYELGQASTTPRYLANPPFGNYNDRRPEPYDGFRPWGVLVAFPPGKAPIVAIIGDYGIYWIN